MIEKNLNVENLNMLIEHLEKTSADNFDMQNWLEGPGMYKTGQDLKAMIKQMQTTGGCGTVGCIAGHAALLARALEFKTTDIFGDIKIIATQWLGLSYEGSGRLFLPENTYGNVISKKLPTVIRTLKHLRDTKRISWSVPVSAYPSAYSVVGAQ